LRLACGAVRIMAQSPPCAAARAAPCDRIVARSLVAGRRPREAVVVTRRCEERLVTRGIVPLLGDALPRARDRRRSHHLVLQHRAETAPVSRSARTTEHAERELLAVGSSGVSRPAGGTRRRMRRIQPSKMVHTSHGVSRCRVASALRTRSRYTAAH
jgi:hypothetical protein